MNSIVAIKHPAKAELGGGSQAETPPKCAKVAENAIKTAKLQN